MQTFVVPKNRKPKFDLGLKILDLNNVPYVSGKIYVKWHLPHAVEHSDRTSKATIKDHKAVFDYGKTVPMRLVVDKNGMLQESHLVFDVMHEVHSGGKEERILLGIVRINLAEYVEASRHSELDGIQRRYLLQDSKINSTLKASIHMNQTEGERNFQAPPLKSAPVFVGIAGVMAGENGEADDFDIPAVNDKAKEAGDELRELYRRTLAAEYTCQPGEPSADQVIEDIFAGGDGWGARPKGQDSVRNRRRAATSDDAGSLSDGDLRPLQSSKRSWPDFQFSQKQGSKPSSRESLLRADDSLPDLPGRRARGSFSQQSHQMRAETDKEWSSIHEIDELEVREDLRCWAARPRN